VKKDLKGMWDPKRGCKSGARRRRKVGMSKGVKKGNPGPPKGEGKKKRIIKAQKNPKVLKAAPSTIRSASRDIIRRTALKQRKMLVSRKKT